jgi:hypothetical protein
MIEVEALAERYGRTAALDGLGFPVAGGSIRRC